MSEILGPDGKTPVKSDAPLIQYKAAGLRFDTQLSPEDLLNKAINGAQQAIAAQVYQSSMQKSGSAVVARSEANSAAANVTDPFMLEPCAMAVFMYLSREIEYRDLIIEQINKKLQDLGQEALDLTHPYPLEKKEEKSDEEKAPSDD